MPPPATTNVCRIWRIHEHLRGVNREAYEPEIVAIGPYHRNKESVQFMQKHKKWNLHQILALRKDQTMETYMSAIRELEGGVRKCYVEPIDLCPENFTKMLVLDGCFIVELLRHYAKKQNEKDPIFQMEWMMKSLQRDLLLFENQIPFFILSKLIDLIEVEGNRIRLVHLIFIFWMDLFEGRELGGKKRDKLGGMMLPPDTLSLIRRYRSVENIKHILDLLHRFFSPDSAPAPYVPEGEDVTEKKRLEERSYCLTMPLPVRQCDGNDGARTDLLIIKSATELRNANMKFKAKKFKWGDAIFDVAFQSRHCHRGTMLVPALHIEDRTECLFRNFIAYEQYQLDCQVYTFTDYARLLNCLIDSPKDVELLSEDKVIINWLGDPNVVAQMINKLTQTISSGPADRFIYAKTFKLVNAHYGKRVNRWSATLKRDYFATPWSFFALLAAVFALLLTTIQTWCALKDGGVIFHLEANN